MLPTMLGAGVALSAGCADDRAVKTDTIKTDTIIAPVDAAYGDFRGLMDAVLAPVDAIYAAADAISASDGNKVDAGPQMDYLAPDAGPVPPYTAADAGK